MKALRMSAAVTSRSDGLSERACCGRERMARQTAYRAVLCERSSLTPAASAKRDCHDSQYDTIPLNVVGMCRVAVRGAL